MCSTQTKVYEIEVNLLKITLTHRLEQTVLTILIFIIMYFYVIFIHVYRALRSCAVTVIGLLKSSELPKEVIFT